MTVDEAKAGLTEGQKLRLDCALNLCKIAASIVSITGSSSSPKRLTATRCSA